MIAVRFGRRMRRLAFLFCEMLATRDMSHVARRRHIGE